MADRVTFSTEARAELRLIDRETALRILKTIDRFLKTNSGDVKQLSGFDPPRFRLRVGDWRVIFLQPDPHRIDVVNVRHRSDAYRS